MTARRGFTLIEMLAAATMLAAVMVIAFQAVAGIAGQHRAAVRRQTALREAANAVERLAALEWDALTPEAAKGAGLSPEARQSLPDAQLRAEVLPWLGDATARQIRVEVCWADAAGQAEAPVRLVAWRYRPAGQKAAKKT